ncbi:MAG: DUF2085 domain-containing protein [Calditrichaceae bacterium]
MIQIITVIMALWLIMLLLAPIIVKSNNPLFEYTGAAVYFFADPICHQLPERSLSINNFPMPVCARCFAVYLGGFLIFLLAFIYRPVIQWPKKLYFYAGAFILPEILLEHLNIYHNNFPLRLLSGFILGMLLFRIVLEAIAQTKVLEKNG